MESWEQVKVSQRAGGSAIAVQAVAGSSRDRIVGVLGDRLKVATSAPAEKGKANRAIARLLAEALGLRPAQVVLSAGAAGARKDFQVPGLSPREVRRRLESL